MENETMDIYTASGSTVLYTGKGGYDSQKEYANRFLQSGTEYEVDRLEVGRSSSSVFLKEFPDKGFNSVHFKNVGSFETVSPSQYNTYTIHKTK